MQRHFQKFRYAVMVGAVLAPLGAFGVASLLAPAHADNLYGDEVVLQGLDKITARVSTFHVKVGQPHRYGSMDIQLFACERTPPEEPPESVAFLKIKDVIDEENPIEYFSGWMYASSPALHGLEHPVHDIWVKECIPSDKPKPKVVVVQSPDSTAEPQKKEKSFLEKIFVTDEDHDEDAVDSERSDSQLKNLESPDTGQATEQGTGQATGNTPAQTGGALPSASTVIKPLENTPEDKPEDTTTTDSQ